MSTTISRAVDYLLHNRAQFLDSCVKNLGFLFPDKLYLSLRYRCIMGKWIDWKNPKTFNEKIQWLKVYDFKPEYTKMVDKYAVKDYVASIIGEEYIIPTLGVWDSVKDIDWDSLPNQFVLKTTHGGGGCGVVICTDKSKLDRKAAEKKLSASMKANVTSTREHPYYKVPKRIIAEKYIADSSSLIVSNLLDYKFFCFDGEPRFLYVSDSPKHESVFLNTDWTFADIGRDDYKPMIETPAKPDNLEEMLTLTRKLSKGKPHVRIDLYNVNEHLYFGEITFFTGSGFIPFNPVSCDRFIGDMLQLPDVKAGGGYLIADQKVALWLRGDGMPAHQPADLFDYKFFCFDGKVKYLAVHAGRFTEHFSNYYDSDWNLQNWGFDCPVQLSHVFQCPANFEEMKSIAEKLSSGHKFLRVDLYNVEGKIYFGELTFYPASGYGKFTPEEWDERLGDLIRIQK